MRRSISPQACRHHGIHRREGLQGILYWQTFPQDGSKGLGDLGGFLEDCEVPEENLLGEVGHGFTYTHETLSWDRSLSLRLRGWFDAHARSVRPLCNGPRPVREAHQVIPGDTAQARRHQGGHRSFPAAGIPVAYDKDGIASQPHTHIHRKGIRGDWGMQAASEGVQIFGGYGYMHEYPVEDDAGCEARADRGGTSEIRGSSSPVS